jgi:hypothetical protein
MDYRSISLLTTDLVSTQLVALGVLPAGHRLMGGFVESAALDSHTTTTLTLSVGVLNTYYGQAAATAAVPAAYSSGGATNTDVDPQLVTGQNVITASTIGRTGGRVNSFVLGFSKDIGIDYTKDRIIAVQFPAAPATAAAGVLALGLLIDQP